jgi:hypothetical protein
MQTLSIEEICSELQSKAKESHFLDRKVENIEADANNFVEWYARGSGLTAHTLGACRWYFQSDKYLVEDGLIELLCKVNPITHKGHCDFEFTNIKEIDLAKQQFSQYKPSTQTTV